MAWTLKYCRSPERSFQAFEYFLPVQKRLQLVLLIFIEASFLFSLSLPTHICRSCSVRISFYLCCLSPSAPVWTTKHISGLILLFLVVIPCKPLLSLINETSFFFLICKMHLPFINQQFEPLWSNLLHQTLLVISSCLPFRALTGITVLPLLCWCFSLFGHWGVCLKNSFTITILYTYFAAMSVLVYVCLCACICSVLSTKIHIILAKWGHFWEGIFWLLLTASKNFWV